jgi:hypothetical protein
VPHTFSNPGDRSVRFLNMSTPAGFEEYMRALGEALAENATLTQAEIGSIASRFDFEAV